MSALQRPALPVHAPLTRLCRCPLYDTLSPPALRPASAFAPAYGTHSAATDGSAGGSGGEKKKAGAKAEAEAQAQAERHLQRVAWTFFAAQPVPLPLRSFLHPPRFSFCCLLLAACCLLLAACCLLLAASRFAVCCVLCAVCCALCAVRCVLCRCCLPAASRVRLPGSVPCECDRSCDRIECGVAHAPVARSTRH